MDVVVTVPKSFGLREWIAEGDAAGTPETGQEYYFHVGRRVPRGMHPGDRVYVVYNNRLRGYAPLVRVDFHKGTFSLVRKGNAVAVTLPYPVKGFMGVRYRWWEREEEQPFPNWSIP